MRAILTRDACGAIVLILDTDFSDIEMMEVYGKALGFQRDGSSTTWRSMARAQPAITKPL